ncbi:MAG: hypothetical protein EA378_10285 [Phycisphaerales bacterium]|nr:MAG: hypothetical protein EA378_10285 [Phycisphaerales bacterium]
MKMKAFLKTTAPLTAAMLFAVPAIGQTERERQPQRPADRTMQPGQQQQTQQRQQQQQQAVYMMAGKATGKDVVNATGEEMGTISDLIVDVRTGATPYAVVSFGGFLGMGRDSVAVPIAALRWDQREEEFMLNTTRERLERAPDFDKDNWDDLHDESWREQVRNAFGQVPGMDRDANQRDGDRRDGQRRDWDQQREGDRDNVRDQDRRNPQQDTRRNQDGRDQDRRGTQPGAHASGEFKPYLMMTDLKGSRVVGSDGDRIGRIDDVIVDQSSGHIGFVTLETGGVLGMGTTTRPIPWEALHRVGENEFRLSVTEDRISQGPELDTDDLTRLSNQQFRQSIYSFYQVQARQQSGGRDGQQQQRDMRDGTDRRDGDRTPTPRRDR